MKKAKKIIFRGLGPQGNIVYKNKIIKDGAIINMEEDLADAYIDLHLAYEVKDEETAKNTRNFIAKTNKRREEIIAKSFETETKKKGDKKNA